LYLSFPGSPVAGVIVSAAEAAMPKSRSFFWSYLPGHFYVALGPVSINISWRRKIRVRVGEKFGDVSSSG
jgi:hypothetical protein